MEEGLEPQELFEQAEKSHHVAAHEGHHEEEEPPAKKLFVMRSAITASVLAVGAALASLLSGHAANEAIVKTIQGSDRWNYYQAKSTKEHIFEANRELLLSLKGEHEQISDYGKKALSAFGEKLAQYEKDKEDIQHKAEDLDKESTLEFGKHQKFSLAVAAFQIGIVLASVAILVTSGWLYYESVAAGLIGLLFVVWGLLL